MAMENIWIGVGFTIGGSLGFGTTTTTGIILNASDLLSLYYPPRRPIRYAEIMQTTYSGIVGIDLAGNYDGVVILAQVLADVHEISVPRNYSSGGDLTLSASWMNAPIGHAIAKLGKIDRSVACLAGISIEFLHNLADFVELIKKYNMVTLLTGMPPSMVLLPAATLPWSFDIAIGWKNQISTNTIQSIGSL